jgi:putative transposase
MPGLIAPGKPMQKAFIESFNGLLRDELLNATPVDLDTTSSSTLFWFTVPKIAA